MLSYELTDRVEIGHDIESKNNRGIVTDTEQSIGFFKVKVEEEAVKNESDQARKLFLKGIKVTMRNYPIMTYNHWIKYRDNKYMVKSIKYLQSSRGQIIQAYDAN